MEDMVHLTIHHLLLCIRRIPLYQLIRNPITTHSPPLAHIRDLAPPFLLVERDTVLSTSISRRNDPGSTRRHQPQAREAAAVTLAGQQHILLTILAHMQHTYKVKAKAPGPLNLSLVSTSDDLHPPHPQLEEEAGLYTVRDKQVHHRQMHLRHRQMRTRLRRSCQEAGVVVV